MTKPVKRQTLADIEKKRNAQATTHNVEPDKAHATTHDAPTRKRATRNAAKYPHVSVYISMGAIVEFKRLALDLGYLSPHELYREALSDLLVKHRLKTLEQIEENG